MDDATTFLAAIARDPDDDAARLGYADWLTGRKDSRGEFIRVQLTLAQLPADDPQRTELERREKSLLKRHIKAWNAELPTWAAHPTPTFRRGFPEIQCSVGDWVKGAAALLKRYPAECVRIKQSTQDIVRLFDSAELLNVRILDLSFITLDEAVLVRMASCSYLRALTGLYLWRCGVNAAGAVVLANAPSLSNVRKLVLEENRIGTDGVEALASSPHLQHLTTLNLRSNHCGPFRGAAFESARFLPTLASLNLGNNEIGSQSAGTLLAAPWQCLRRLDLDGNAMHDTGVATLNSAAHLQGLQELDVAHNGLTVQGATAVAAASCLSKLTTLGIGANPIGAAGVRALANSAFLTGLQELSLDMADVGNEGVEALATAAHWQRLRCVRLQDANISEDGALTLASAENLPALEQLTLGGNRLGTAARRALRDRFGKRVSL